MDISNIFHYLIYGQFFDRPAFFLFLFGMIGGMLLLFGTVYLGSKLRYGSEEKYLEHRIEVLQIRLKTIQSRPQKVNGQKKMGYSCPFCRYVYTRKDNTERIAG